MNKRTKSKNFTSDELYRLISLVEKMPSLTSKKTDAITNSSKEASWSQVAEMFNAENGSIHRDVSQLKLKWDNVKKAAKKRATTINCNNRATGGGEGAKIVPDPILDRVIGMIKLFNCVGPRSYCDDDAGHVALEFCEERGFVLDAGVALDTQHKTMVETIPVQTLQVDEGPQTSSNGETTTAKAVVESVFGNSKWDSWNPTLLKTPVNTKLKSKKRKTLQEQLMESKIRKNNSIASKNNAIASYYEDKLKNRVSNICNCNKPTIPLNRLEQVQSPPVGLDNFSDECGSSSI